MYAATDWWGKAVPTSNLARLFVIALKMSEHISSETYASLRASRP